MHFVTMLLAQISGQHGLRSIEQTMNHQQNSWYHLGIPNAERSVKRSTLSYANAHRSADMYKALFESLVTEAQVKCRNSSLSFTQSISVMKTMLFHRVSLFELLGSTTHPRPKPKPIMQFSFCRRLGSDINLIVTFYSKLML